VESGLLQGRKAQSRISGESGGMAGGVRMMADTKTKVAPCAVHIAAHQAARYSGSSLTKQLRLSDSLRHG
jgi:hypothetical protein